MTYLFKAIFFWQNLINPFQKRHIFAQAFFHANKKKINVKIEKTHGKVDWFHSRSNHHFITFSLSNTFVNENFICVCKKLSWYFGYKITIKSLKVKEEAPIGKNSVVNQLMYQIKRKCLSFATECHTKTQNDKLSSGAAKSEPSKTSSRFYQK